MRTSNRELECKKDYKVQISSLFSRFIKETLCLNVFNVLKAPENIFKRFFYYNRDI